MKEKKDLMISSADEVFARKVTSYLNQGLNLPENIQGKLFVARSLAVADKKLSEEELRVREIKDIVSDFMKKGYMSLSNNIMALALMVAAVPVGMNVVNFESSNGGASSNISAVIDHESYYLDNIYHTHADELEEDYLQEIGFI